MTEKESQQSGLDRLRVAEEAFRAMGRRNLNPEEVAVISEARATRFGGQQIERHERRRRARENQVR